MKNVIAEYLAAKTVSGMELDAEDFEALRDPIIRGMTETLAYHMAGDESDSLDWSEMTGMDCRAMAAITLPNGVTVAVKASDGDRFEIK